MNCPKCKKEVPLYGPDQTQAIKVEYEHYLHLNKIAGDALDSGKIGSLEEMEKTEKDLSYSAGYMDGLSQACKILTGSYATEIIKQ